MKHKILVLVILGGMTCGSHAETQVANAHKNMSDYTLSMNPQAYSLAVPVFDRYDERGITTQIERDRASAKARRALQAQYARHKCKANGKC
ncbi:MAG: hypothetical protein R8K48_05950 [Gallionella sp.]